MSCLIKASEVDTGKVKLPKEVAEAIEFFKDFTSHWEALVMSIALSQERFVGPSKYCHYIKDFCKSHNNILVLMKALVNGYQTELTPFERAIQYLIERDIVSRGHSEHDVVTAILNILGVKEHG